MAYPVVIKIDRPEKLSRLTTFFRIFMVIPQFVVFVFVSIAGAVIYFLSWWAIIFTGNYPQTFFKFVTWWFRWGARLFGYMYLLTDKYPPFTGDSGVAYPVTLEVETPGKLSRLTTFLRLPISPSPDFDMLKGWRLSTGLTGWPMTIPQQVVLFFLGIAAAVVLFLTWWAILFTARYPKAFFDYVTWYLRWDMRVSGYTLLLTDKYPPFSGAEEAASEP
ncbi:MAG: DUF4389 domain-containing protein [Chloroflexi bacterium]|nr:DUF4389 domain-containing protein [Chloroflexota bacterium]